MAQKFHGNVVFEIVLNGDMLILNGIYSTNKTEGPLDKAYTINTEIAKRKLNAGESINDLVGTYNTRHIESEVLNGEMKISLKDEVYLVEWLIENKQKYEGIGLKAGNNHLAVAYVKS